MFQMLILLLPLLSSTHACHFTRIGYENGTWCCGDTKQADVGDDGTAPPGVATVLTTGAVLTTGTGDDNETLTTSPMPVIPVGECVCGLGVDLEETTAGVRIANADDDRARMLVRPWLAHIWIHKDSMEYLECSGSLLNRRWFISAAHCFCGTIHKCPVAEQGFAKIWPDPDAETDSLANRIKGRVKVQFGTLATTDPGARQFYTVDKIVIHPDYCQGPNEQARPHDVALLRVSEEISLQLITDPRDKITGIVPICLPPFGPVKPSDIISQPDSIDPKPVPAFIGARELVLNATARIPFEDMDCFMVNGPVPYPYTSIPDVDQGHLSCHPKGMFDSLGLNIAGRTSFITAFGSTSREAGAGGDKSLRYMCRTNAYGPKDSIFHDCHGKCHKEVRDPYVINKKKTRAPNPSVHNDICKKFIEKVASTGKMEEDFQKDLRVKNIPHIQAAKVLLIGEDQVITECYPFKNYEAAKKVRSMYDFPYKHGWCSVCERKGKDKTSECENLLSEDKNWGWCQPECDEDWVQPDWHTYAHEAVVDSFVYENCSHGIDTFTEFCTGSKLLTAYTMHYTHSAWADGVRFQFVTGEMSELHPGDTKWNNNGTIIRPGARYQGVQHTQAEGDVCYGDAGGSVWKLWSFRDLSNKNKKDTTVRRPPWGKLAVLTGVISRFEQHCGFFRPDHSSHWARPVQHSVHARVQMYMRWIMKTIGEEGQCEPPTESTKPSENPPTEKPEQRSGTEIDERMSNTNSWEFKDYADDADEWVY